MFKHAIIAAAFGFVAIAAPAAAQSSVAVEYSDLNLASEAGRATLENRLEGAVRDVCGAAPRVTDLRAMAGYRACIAVARASYTEQVRVAVLEAEGRQVAVLASGLRFPA